MFLGPGFLKDLIEKWKSSGDGTRWIENSGQVQSAPEKIQAGVSRLSKFILSAQSGTEILIAWTKAGYHQYWQSIVANEIVNHADGKPEKSSDEMVALLKRMRADYKFWAETWMTPESAEINSGLIFDAITDYFSEYK